MRARHIATLAALGLVSCVQPLAPDPSGRCAALAATCGGDAWETWCRSTCLPDVARAASCPSGDVCALCGDAEGRTFYTFGNGCAVSSPVCSTALACPAGQRVWVDGGPCAPADPCADDTHCAAVGRVCVADAGAATCGRCLDDGVDHEGTCTPAAPPHVGPFRVSRDHFQVWDGTRYRALFLRGVNVGGPRPGEAGSETSLGEADWLRWMAMWADAGMNVVRVYHLHPPELYDALVAWNGAHPSAPIYLLQGVYYPEVEAGGDIDFFSGGESFDALVAHDVDCIHGACEGYPDASAWTLAWLVGRELMPDEVIHTDMLHAETTSYTGTALSIAATTPTAAWIVERMDHALAWERAHHAAERPIGWTLWPVLDPLSHPTERPRWQADLVRVDLAPVDATHAPAGHFISYHSYPYDPDFLAEDAELQTHADRFGPDSYRGYLRALREHYADQAFLVAEFGVPTSRAPAHTSTSGMAQGGLDETQQGRFAARMLENIEDAGAAGGVWFQWEDGWWKQSWTSLRRAFPRSRFPLWHNLLDPEQSFGLVSFEPALTAPTTLAIAGGSAHVRAIRASSSAAIVRFEIELDAPLGAGETLELGLDVLDPTRGEPALPSGRALVASRAEAAITLTDDDARFRITACLDTNRLLDDERFVTATRAGGCGWADLRWVMTNQHERPPSGCFVTRDFYDLGALHVRAGDAPPRSDDVIVVDGAVVRVELPWSMLVVSDPSTRSVLDDDPATADADATVSEGIALAVLVRGELVESAPYAWPTWDTAPATTERLKDGAETFFAYTRALPRFADGAP